MHKKNELEEFFKDIDTTKITPKELQTLKVKFAKKYKLKNIPLTSDILSVLNIKKPTNTFVTKPHRTQSGVTVIAVMTKPTPCPGKCIYCPSYKGAPKSYTGFEPASMRGKLNKFNPKSQIKERLKQLQDTGHPTNKLEVIIMGGTFPATSKKYQDNFIRGIYQAITNNTVEKNIKTLEKIAMTSEKRMVGLTFETRPDYCDEKIIKRLLDYGGTRVEIGVQTIYNDVFKKNKRGHTIKEVIETTKKLKDAGFKVLYHMMIGLPGSDYKKDLDAFKEIFTNPLFCPDMIKIYPCLVTKNTELEKMYYSGEYTTYDNKTLINLIADIKEMVPKWIRIMRIQRDIPATKIIAGSKISNLREQVLNELKNRGTKCNCIKCCEPEEKLKDTKKYKIKIIKYVASDSEEYFIYAEKENYLLGFLRLRFPNKPFINEIKKNTSIVRELHVYGLATSFEDKNIQHNGIGKKLLMSAEKISKNNKFTKIAVISGVGVRKYYEKQGYKLIGTYMIKEIKD